ncbi:hypothetical protein MMC20_007124 [Loxospora ochrophaea]|nr:hypothetical protein [Loxospora ochrophaea]
MAASSKSHAKQLIETIKKLRDAPEYRNQDLIIENPLIKHPDMVMAPPRWAEDSKPISFFAMVRKENYYLPSWVQCFIVRWMREEDIVDKGRNTLPDKKKQIKVAFDALYQRLGIPQDEELSQIDRENPGYPEFCQLAREKVYDKFRNFGAAWNGKYYKNVAPNGALVRRDWADGTQEWLGPDWDGNLEKAASGPSGVEEVTTLVASKSEGWDAGQLKEFLTSLKQQFVRQYGAVLVSDVFNDTFGGANRSQSADVGKLGEFMDAQKEFLTAMYGPDVVSEIVRDRFPDASRQTVDEHSNKRGRWM